ncbi:MAG: MFS transporter, partial [Chloroflexota bacterium]
MSQSKEVSLNAQIILLTFTRLVQKIALRMVFSFLPQFARGLDVTVADVQRTLAFQSVAGFASPFLVPISEKFGRKWLILASTIVFIMASLLIVMFPSLAVLAMVVALISGSGIFYDANMRAYLADRIPFARRGRALAITETSWALSMLVGAPLVGVLIARFDFTAPYLVLAMISLALLPILWRNLAFDAKPVDGDRIDWGKITRTALRSPRIVAPTLFIVSVMSAGTLIFVTYADWLEREFAVNLGGLAQTAVMIGVAELIGEFLSGALSDRVNKKWFVLSTGAGIAAMCLIMPHAPTRVLALVGLFVYFVFFETTVVSTIPIFSELMPEARTVPLSLLALAV